MKAQRIKLRENGWEYFTRSTTAINAARDLAKRSGEEVKIESVTLTASQMLAALNNELEHDEVKPVMTMTVEG